MSRLSGWVIDVGAGTSGHPVPPRSLVTLGELLLMAPTEVSRLDLGLRNLLCATGLPDTAELDIQGCLEKLRQWTQHVGRETQRNFHRFTADPAKHQGSEAYFRVAMLITVLQQDCGVHYEPDNIKSELFVKSSEAFIHGLLNAEGGTCANIPVLYAAVGRRLG